MSAPADDPVAAAVYAGWRTALARDEFDPDLTLVAGGADSLRIMRFVLDLEARLGRAVPYDMLSPEITPRQLAALLRPEAPGAALAPPPVRPVLFLLGGIGGDETMLGALRRGLDDLFEPVLLAAPGAEQPAEVLTDLGRTAALVADAIAARQPDGALRLLGYSFGGLLAFEAARVLQARGRRVKLLCLLDAAPLRGPLRRLATLLANPRAITRKLRALAPRWRRGARGARRVNPWLELAYRLGAYRTAARFARGADRADAAAEAWLAERLDVWSLRVRAARGWRPAGLDLDGSALLIVSDDGRAWGVARFWRRLLPGIAQTGVPGAHRELASPAALATIRAMLVDVSAVADNAL